MTTRVLRGCLMKNNRGDRKNDRRSLRGKVLISFDVEEFDLPREHGGEISLAEGVKVSAKGLAKVLDMLKRCGVRATFFVTGNFALTAPEMVERIVRDGHEVGCHGVDHFNPCEGDVARSREIVAGVVEKYVENSVENAEEKSGAGGAAKGEMRADAVRTKVVGWRQPRMFKIDYKELKKNGFLYDTSVNPAWVPGRYNHRDVPLRPFVREEIVEVPVSVASSVRVPLFWLALHLFPVALYTQGAKMALRKTGYFATYFHPWEFSDELMGYGMVPGYIKRNSGDKLVARLEKVIMELLKAGCEFETYGEFVEGWK